MLTYIHMQIYIYVHIYMCIYIPYVYIDMCIHIYIYIYICIHIICIHVYMHMCISVCIYTCIYVSMGMCGSERLPYDGGGAYMCKPSEVAGSLWVEWTLRCGNPRKTTWQMRQRQFLVTQDNFSSAAGAVN